MGIFKKKRRLWGQHKGQHIALFDKKLTGVFDVNRVEAHLTCYFSCVKRIKMPRMESENVRACLTSNIHLISCAEIFTKS